MCIVITGILQHCQHYKQNARLPELLEKDDNQSPLTMEKRSVNLPETKLEKVVIAQQSLWKPMHFH